MAHYVAIMDKEDGTFGIWFPDFPGCVASGKNEDEVLENAREALAFHVEGMQEDGEVIVPPTSLAQIKDQGAIDKSHIVTAIPLVQVLGQPVRVNMSIDAGKLRLIDEEAKARSLTRSAFMVAAAMEQVA